VDGIFVGIEVKADRTKKPTELQVKCGKEIREAGAEWFLVCDDTSLLQVEQFIKRNR